MRHRALSLLGLASLALALHGDSCLIEKKETDFVVRADIPAVWHTEGTNSSGGETQTVSAASEVENALNSLESDAMVDSIKISGVCYEVLANSGFVGAHMGSVTVSDGGPAKTLLTFHSPSNGTGATGSSEGAEVSLSKAGVDLINAHLATYLATRDEPQLEFTFAASWESDPPPAGQHYDFDWKTCLILQVVGTLEQDVFDP